MDQKEQTRKLYHQMKSAVTLHAKIQHVLQLINSTPEFVDTFANSYMKQIAAYLKETLKGFPAQEELMDKILQLLMRINLTEEMVSDSDIGGPFFKIKEKKLLESTRSNLVDQIQTKWSKCYTKNRQVFDDWKKQHHTKKKNKRNSSSSESRKRKPRRKMVRFVQDEQLIRYKYFKREDEPNKQGMSEAEVFTYQKQYAEDVKRSNQVNGAYNIKHRESMMEGQSHRQQLDSVQQMVEQIPFIKPSKLNLLPQEKQETNFIETQVQQNRIDAKISTFYGRDNQIPEQPGQNEISNNRLGSPYKIIHLDPPKREDLMYMVQVICNRGLKELEEKNKNITKKQIKSILKKPPEEQSKQKDILTQVKQDLEPKMSQLIGMVEQKQNHSQESILTLLHDIIQKLKELGEELYIKNVKSLLEQKLNDKLSQSQDDSHYRAQLEHQQRMRNIEQLQMINPIQAQRLRAYKTKHCHNYHSGLGCTRGDNCNFIHDSRYQGRPVPNQAYPNFLNRTLYPPSTNPPSVPHLLQQLNPGILLGRQKKYESL